MNKPSDKNRWYEIQVPQGSGVQAPWMIDRKAPAVVAAEADGSLFTLDEILSRDRVKLRLGKYYLCKEQRTEFKKDNYGETVVFSRGEKLRAWTPSSDAGENITIRFSDLDHVPQVTADDAVVVEALKRDADLTIDEAGSVQVVQPQGKLVEPPNRRLGRFFVPRTRLTDEDLRLAAKLNNLRELNIGGGTISDASLVCLKGLNRLARLDLSDTNITDAGLSNIEGLTSLEELNLSGTKITNAGLRHLAGLRRLEVLALNTTDISSPGLEHLIGLPRLEELLLYQSNVNDAVVDLLGQMKGLASVDLRESCIGGAGYWKLSKTLPHLFRDDPYHGIWGYWEHDSSWRGPKDFNRQRMNAVV